MIQNTHKSADLIAIHNLVVKGKALAQNGMENKQLGEFLDALEYFPALICWPDKTDKTDMFVRYLKSTCEEYNCTSIFTKYEQNIENLQNQSWITLDEVVVRAIHDLLIQARWYAFMGMNPPEKTLDDFFTAILQVTSIVISPTKEKGYLFDEQLKETCQNFNCIHFYDKYLARLGKSEDTQKH
ncbi:MAG: hypothetical protein ACKVTZ_09645 [Bacteroidia bacterium]